MLFPLSKTMKDTCLHIQPTTLCHNHIRFEQKKLSSNKKAYDCLDFVVYSSDLISPFGNFATCMPLIKKLLSFIKVITITD